MSTKTETAQGVGPVAPLFGGSVLEELMRLDKIVRDCEHSLLIAERLKARGRWQAKWDAELAETRKKLANTMRERDWLDGAIARYASSPNNPVRHDGAKPRSCL